MTVVSHLKWNLATCDRCYQELLLRKARLGMILWTMSSGQWCLESLIGNIRAFMLIFLPATVILPFSVRCSHPVSALSASPGQQVQHVQNWRPSCSIGLVKLDDTSSAITERMSSPFRFKQVGWWRCRSLFFRSILVAVLTTVMMRTKKNYLQKVMKKPTRRTGIYRWPMETTIIEVKSIDTSVVVFFW